VKKGKVPLIPAVVHVDETSRIQIVKRNTNPRYHKLISEFNKLTGIPMVLNTSFNDNEPIVCTPEDAVRTFQRTRMDYLVIHNFLLKQK
jgi:carbamoyltransferase